MIYSIGDLHLGSKVKKPMSIFGNAWEKHPENIRDEWLEVVKENDAIVIPGDISWAMTLEESYADLAWIDELPGKKYLIKGNHDYWWKSIKRLNTMFNSLYFIQNNYFAYEEIAICGTRGWICPGSPDYMPKDQKIYEREAARLKLSLEAAVKAGYEEILAMVHFPPTNDKKEPSLYTRLFEEYNVKQVVYGHIHGKDSILSGPTGIINGVAYYLASCDCIDFKLIRLK